MAKQNNQMDYKIKLAIVTGNVQAMEALLKEIKQRVAAAREGVEWIDADDDRSRLYSALGGLNGVEASINALKALVDASFCIGKS